MPQPPAHDVSNICRSGDRCPDNTHGQPAPRGRTQLCDRCLDHAVEQARTDIHSLLFDWLDLEQLHHPSLAQALTGQPNGSPQPAMPLNGAADALQAEIAWALGTWEHAVRADRQLHQPPTNAVRAGHRVWRAVTLLTRHTRTLAELPARPVQAAGCEDPPAPMDGVDALHHLSKLHARARGMLGRTRRTFWVPGDCSHCGATQTPGVPGPLYRSEPRDEGDEPPVYCDRCGNSRTEADYQRYLTMLVWPALHSSEAA